MQQTNGKYIGENSERHLPMNLTILFVALSFTSPVLGGSNGDYECSEIYNMHMLWVIYVPKNTNY